jgi:NTE family protein
VRHQLAAYRPGILIEIPVDACRMLDFHRTGEMIDLGYDHAQAALRRGGAQHPRPATT